MFFAVLLLPLFLSSQATATDIPSPFGCNELNCIIKEGSRIQGALNQCLLYPTAVKSSQAPVPTSFFGDRYIFNVSQPISDSWSVGVSTRTSPDNSTMEIEKTFLLTETQFAKPKGKDDVGCAVFFEDVQPIFATSEDIYTSGNTTGCPLWLYTTVNRLIEEGTRDNKTMECTDLEEVIKNLEVGDQCPAMKKDGNKFRSIHVETIWGESAPPRINPDDLKAINCEPIPVDRWVRDVSVVHSRKYTTPAKGDEMLDAIYGYTPVMTMYWNNVVPQDRSDEYGMGKVGQIRFVSVSGPKLPEQKKRESSSSGPTVNGVRGLWVALGVTVGIVVMNM